MLQEVADKTGAKNEFAFGFLQVIEDTDVCVRRYHKSRTMPYM